MENSFWFLHVEGTIRLKFRRVVGKSSFQWCLFKRSRMFVDNLWFEVRGGAAVSLFFCSINSAREFVRFSATRVDNSSRSLLYRWYKCSLPCLCWCIARPIARSPSMHPDSENFHPVSFRLYFFLDNSFARFNQICESDGIKKLSKFFTPFPRIFFLHFIRVV